MAIRFIDGFDGADIERRGWIITSAAQVSALAGGPYGTGYSMRASNGDHGANRNLPGGGYERIILGFSVLAPATFTSGGTMGLYVTNGTDNLRLYWVNSSTIRLLRGVTELATASYPYPGAVWQRHEIEATFHGSTGIVNYRVNGATVLAFTGQTSTLGATNVTGFYVRSVTFGQSLFDDFVVMDEIDGTTLTPPQAAAYNTFLGDARVQAYAPNGAGSSTQWTPSTGANWAAVDETPVSDADYVSSSTSGHRDLYAFPDRSGTPSTIHAAAFVTHANKDDAGARSMRHVVKSGAATQLGADTTLGATFVANQTLHPTNPNTGTAWTDTTFNAAEFGMEVV